MIEVQSYFEHLVFFGPIEDSYLEQGTLVGYLVILDWKVDWQFEWNVVLVKDFDFKMVIVKEFVWQDGQVEVEPRNFKRL